MPTGGHLRRSGGPSGEELWSPIVLFDGMTKVLFDTDPGCDDAVALALALASDDIELVGVTTVVGNTTIENTTRNALSVLTLFDRTDVPVARGCGTPLYRDPENAESVHGAGGITGDPPAPAVDPVDATGVEFMLERVREHGSDLTIVAVGPMTNLAAAIAIEPDLPEMVDDVYLMGGAALSPGNVTPEAEFNFYVDPEAAHRVIHDATPRMVGLDATHEATVPAEYVEELAAGEEPRRTLAAWLGYAEVEEILGGALSDAQVVHDATVVIDIVDGVLDYRSLPLDVGTGDGNCRGAVSADVNGVTGEPPNARVAVDVDLDAYRESMYGLVDSL